MYGRRYLTKKHRIISGNIHHWPGRASIRVEIEGLVRALAMRVSITLARDDTRKYVRQAGQRYNSQGDRESGGRDFRRQHMHGVGTNRD